MTDHTDAFGKENSKDIPTQKDLNSWLEYYFPPSKANSCTRMFLAHDYYFHENFGAAYFYAETVLNHLNFENLKKEFNGEDFEKTDFQKWTEESLSSYLTAFINELKPMLNEQEKLQLNEINIEIMQNLENLFEKYLPRGYRTYKMLKDWFKDEVILK